MISSQLVFDARENSISENLKYYHDGSNVIAEYDVSDNLSRRYIHGTTYVDERAMLLEGSGADLDTFYYLLEDLHTVTGMMHKNGSLAEGYTYDAYGRPRIMWYHPTDVDRDGDVDTADIIRVSLARNGSGNPTNHPRTDIDMDGDTDDTDLFWVLVWEDLVDQPEALWTSAVGNPYFFTGRRMNWVEADFAGDPAENKPLQYNRARHYCSVHGRWLQRDPLGYADGMNLYEYVSSRPTVLSDPSGKLKKSCGNWVANGAGTAGWVYDNAWVADSFQVILPTTGIGTLIKEIGGILGRDRVSGYLTNIDSLWKQEGTKPVLNRSCICEFLSTQQVKKCCYKKTCFGTKDTWRWTRDTRRELTRELGHTVKLYSGYACDCQFGVVPRARATTYPVAPKMTMCDVKVE